MYTYFTNICEHMCACVCAAKTTQHCKHKPVYYMNTYTYTYIHTPTQNFHA